MTSNARAEICPERLRDLLRDLVDIYSPSGKEEEILEFTAGYLLGHGLAVSKQEVDDNRYNLLVFPAETDRMELCFVGHLDTVTAHDLDEFGFREKGGEVFGLGTADMKGGCAAMIEVFTVLAERGGDMSPAGLALLVDEEEDNSGARALVRRYRFPRAIIGEPTALTPCLGHYAYLEAELRTRGRRAHSAVPEAGQNAIENMLRLLLHVTERLNPRGEGLVYNIRDVTGFPGGFVVPDACEAWLDLHLPPALPIDDIKGEMRRLVREAGKEIAGLNASLEFVSTYPGYRLDPEEPLAFKLKETFARLGLPWRPQDFRSHSDGNVLSAAGVSPVILGPGRLEAAHAPEESVPFEQVVRAAQVYLDLASSL
jgi:acetylornithine deacetylase